MSSPNLVNGYHVHKKESRNGKMLGLGKKNQKILIDWTNSDRGHEVSRSADVIGRLMEQLIAERIMLFLHHKGYSSSGTMLLENSDGQIVLDMPQDWPGTERSIRVDFNGPEGLRYYFYGDVSRASGDTIVLPLPREVFRMQLRHFFRVELPSGSVVCFHHKKNSYENLAVRDMSAGGMKITSKERLDFEKFDLISKIVLLIPSSSLQPAKPRSLVERQKMAAQQKERDAQQAELPRRLEVKSAKLVHISFDTQQKVYGYGVQFRLDPRDQERLQQFVRTRELEMLRLGVTKGG